MSPILMDGPKQARRNGKEWNTYLTQFEMKGILLFSFLEITAIFIFGEFTISQQDCEDKILLVKSSVLIPPTTLIMVHMWLGNYVTPITLALGCFTVFNVFILAPFPWSRYRKADLQNYLSTYFPFIFKCVRPKCFWGSGLQVTCPRLDKVCGTEDKWTWVWQTKS